MADLVLCAPVVEREAREQNKTLEEHYAHLLVHGTLHAQGWDHETSEQDAEEMEDRKSTRLNSSHLVISYAVFCLKKKKQRRPYTAPRDRARPFPGPPPRRGTALTSRHLLSSSGALRLHLLYGGTSRRAGRHGHPA